MQKKKKPKVEGAPLYMGQYASLMTILLAFFIALLTMTTESISELMIEYRMVQTAFSFDSGIGVLRFVKSLLPYQPDVEEKPEEDDRFYLAYSKGTFQHRRFDQNHIDKIELQYLKQVVRVVTPIDFPAGSAAIRKEDLTFLDRIAALFRNLPERSITVACYSSTGDGEADQALAARRAAAIARYLEERGEVPKERLQPVGYSEVRYLGDMENIRSDQATLFFIGTISERTKM